MRDIRFRAWDKQDKKMLKWLELLDLYVAELFVDPIRAFKLMQYTGLKDKNGKEIYEGDIVEDRSEIGTFIGDIRFISGSFCIWYNGNLGDFSKEYIPVYGGMEHYEVIGNIYENKDLLEGK